MKLKNLYSILDKFENIQILELKSGKFYEIYFGNVDVTISEFFARYENDLYLIIQVPATNDSSIVILEGDFTSIDTTNIFNMSYINSLSEN